MQRQKDREPGVDSVTAGASRLRWSTPTVEVFDISDVVKGPAGTESDSLGGLQPAS